MPRGQSHRTGSKVTGFGYSLGEAELKGKCRNATSGCKRQPYRKLDKSKLIEIVPLKATKGKQGVCVLKGICSVCGWQIGRILPLKLKHK